MIEQRATVVAEEGDAVWVETRRDSACGACARNQGCGAVMLAKAFGFASPRLRVPAGEGARLGDRVVIGIDERALVRGSFAAYLAPILFMLGFALLGEGALPGSDLLALPFGAAGLGAGLVWMRRYNRRAAADRRFQPVILQKDRDNAPPLCVVSRQFNS